MPHNKNLSRRDALKTLAAVTGAVALTSLPGKWAKPVVEVGALPAHAQGSFTIRLISAEFIRVNDCANGNGSTAELILDYNDPTGNVTVSDTSILMLYMEGHPSNVSGSNQWPLSDTDFTVVGDEFTGRITGSMCITFPDGDTEIYARITLQNDIGLVSNSVSITRQKPTD